VAEKLAKRQIIVLRELTKLNEQMVVRPNETIIEPIKPIGEFCIVVLEEPEAPDREIDQIALQEKALELFHRLVAGGQVSDDFAIELVALKLAVTEAVARKAVKKAKISVKQQKQQ